MESVTISGSDWVQTLGGSGPGDSVSATNWGGEANIFWTPSYWHQTYPMYSVDKATVAFRVLKRLVDRGLIKPNLSLKKFLALVEEIVQCL